MSQKVYNFSIDNMDTTISYTHVFKFTKHAKNILDIGCATGFFSQYLVKNGSQVVGIELNPKAAKQAQKICQQVIVGNIEDTKLQSKITNEFDAVILSDVLEHLQDPKALLVHIRKTWLKSNGHVVISIPNSGHWVFRREILWGRFPYRRYGLFDETHLRFFTWSSLAQLIKDSGYVIKKRALTVNRNYYDDITFALLTPLYRHRPDFRNLMIKIESLLATRWPTLFAYQFVLQLQSNHHKETVPTENSLS